MTHNYFNDSKMKVPYFLGHTLFDIHTHIAKKQGLEQTLKRIVDVGGVGSSISQPLPYENKIYSYDPDRFSYESLIKSKPKGIGITEIDKGRLAKIDIDGKIGYILNVQEVSCKEKFHIHAIGFPYFKYPKGMPNKVDAKDLFNMIHNCGGIAQINHPYCVSNEKPSLFRYKWITKQEERTLKELAPNTDLFEVFNAQQKDIALGIDFWFLDRINAGKNNKKAKKFAQENGLEKKATKNSDAHSLLEQVGVVGNFIPNQYVDSWEGIRYAFNNKKFITSKNQEVSRISFVNGMGLPEFIKDTANLLAK